uniref:T-cell acute lymphocytic leukemia protein 2 n=1 Tax=Steinernema glaseri TaxID=37863 RepID=A0A1I7ZMA4_9BILA
MSTQDVALQYYSVLAELCAGWPSRRQAPDAKPMVPKVMMRLGYLRSSDRQIILHVHRDLGSTVTLTCSFSPQRVRRAHPGQDHAVFGPLRAPRVLPALLLPSGGFPCPDDEDEEADAASLLERDVPI